MSGRPGNFIDLVGKRFGRLVVIEYAGKSKWLCRCDCGNMTTVAGGSLKNGNTKSCGCLHKEAVSRKRVPPVKLGDVFGYWTVIQTRGAPRRYQVLCRCICGKEKWVETYSLLDGSSKSCGCKIPKPKPRHTDYGIHPGDRVGYWTILEQHGSYFKCKCVCGKTKNIMAVYLISGRSQSCGCQRLNKPSEAQVKGKEKGQEIIKKIQENHLYPKYIGRKVNRNSRTGITGVTATKYKGKSMYRAYITVDRHQINLGCYESIYDAINARKYGEDKYFSKRQEKVNEIKKSLKLGGVENDKNRADKGTR